MILHHITTGIVALGFALGLAVMVAYWVLSPWERHPVGRMTMALVGSVTAVQGLSLAARIWGEYLGRAILILIMYASFVVTLGWLLALVVGNQLYARRNGRDGHKRDDPRKGDGS